MNFVRWRRVRVRFEFDGVERGEQRIEQLVDGIGWPLRRGACRILALQQACEPIIGHRGERRLARKVCRATRCCSGLRFGGVEYFEDWAEIGFGVWRPTCSRASGGRSFGDAGGIADHGGDNRRLEDGGVAHVLEVF